MLGRLYGAAAPRQIRSRALADGRPAAGGRGAGRPASVLMGTRFRQASGPGGHRTPGARLYGGARRRAHVLHLQPQRRDAGRRPRRHDALFADRVRGTPLLSVSRREPAWLRPRRRRLHRRRLRPRRHQGEAAPRRGGRRQVMPTPLNDLYFLWYAAEWLIRFAALAVVPLRRSPAAAAGWLLLIFFIPVPGLILYLLFSIFADDAVGQGLAAELAQAVRRGVRCRVMFDAIGSHHWRRGTLQLLRTAGVEVREALPVRWLRRHDRADMRNHRKLFVI